MEQQKLIGIIAELSWVEGFLEVSKFPDKCMCHERVKDVVKKLKEEVSTS